MSNTSGKLKRNLKRLFGVLCLLGILLIMLILLGWRVVRADHAYTIEKARELVRNHYNAAFELGGYQLKWVKPYPSLDIILKDVRLASVLDSTAPILRTNQLRTRVNLRDWWAGELKAQPVTMDSAWVHFRKDTEGRSNLRFVATSERKKIKPWNFSLTDLPEVSFNFLDLHNENLERNKWQRAKMLSGQIATHKNDEQQDILNLTSIVHFDGLMFNQEDGGYLTDQKGIWDLNFGLADNGLVLKLLASKLNLDSAEFLIDGALHRADTNQLILNIRNHEVLMSTVLPMLSDKVQEKLSEIKIDQPVDAFFSLNERLHPSKKGVIKVGFSSTDAAVNFRKLSVEHTGFLGYYSNDCNENGIVDEVDDCVVFEYVKGDLFGVLPTEAKGRIDRLFNPELTALGTMDISLPRLNELLSRNNKLTFKDGVAQLEITYRGPFNDIIIDPFNEERVKMQGEVTFADVILDLPTGKAPFPTLAGHMHFNDQGTQLRQLNLEWMGAAVQLSGALKNLPEFLFFKNQALQSNLKLHFDHLDFSELGKDAAELEIEDFDYQKVRSIARNIARNINGQLELEIDRLTYDTFELTDLQTQFSLFSPLLYDESSSSAMINMEKLSGKFAGRTPFEIDLGISQENDPKLLLAFDFPDAQVFANTFLPKGNGINSGSVSMQFRGEVPLRNINRLNQTIDSLNYFGEIKFDEVNAEIASFTWPLKTISGDLYFDQDRLDFEDIHFHYEGAPFDLNGTVRDYRKYGREQALVDLRLVGRSLNWRNNQLENRANENTRSSTSPAELFRRLDTVYHLVNGRLQLTLDTIYTLDHIIMPFHARMELGEDPNLNAQYQLQLDSMRIGFGGRNVISGRAKITNPEKPQLDAQVRTVLNFQKLADFLPSEYIELQDGFFRARLDYQVPLYDTINARNYLLGAELKGEAEIVNGKLFYNYRGFQIDNFYGHISFNNRDLTIRDLDLRLNGNRLFADGISDNFFPFFIRSNRKARIEMNVASPNFDFGRFTAPRGLGKDSISLDSTISVLQKTRGFIDRLLNNGTLDMNLDFDLLKYEDFLAKDLRGNISLHPDTVRLDSVQMNLAKGEFLIDGSITDIVYHRPKIAVDAQFLESNIRQLFNQFQNFGQTDLDSTNIKGYASVDLKFRSDANSNYALLPNTMHGNFQIKLSGGQLINLPSIRQISGFLSKKRQLDHIVIDTLETISHLRGNDLYIDQFRLESSSFDFNVEGVYSLGEEDNTRILFGVPLSNLFRRHISVDEREKDNKGRKGLKIFIEARPHKRKDKMRFRWKVPLTKKPYRLPRHRKEKD